MIAKRIQYVSFKRKTIKQGIEFWELIVSPNKSSLVGDISNAVAIERMITAMIAHGYHTYDDRRDDGMRIVTFSKAT